MHGFVQDEIKTMEARIEQKLFPLHEALEKTNQMLNQLMANKCVENSFEPHREEASNLRKDHPPWFLNSQHHTLGDTHQGHRGPKLDMHKFDGTNPTRWASQMEHFFYLYNICTDIDKYQVALLYLDVEHWQWWQWHKQCMGGHLIGLPSPKFFVSVLIENHIFWVG